jgi:nucleoside-triphosphatase THEP1
MKVIIFGNAMVGKTTLVQELLQEVGGGAGFYTEVTWQIHKS